jgi:hypothetical protein
VLSNCENLNTKKESKEGVFIVVKIYSQSGVEVNAGRRGSSGSGFNLVLLNLHKTRGKFSVENLKAEKLKHFHELKFKLSARFCARDNKLTSRKFAFKFHPPTLARWKKGEENEFASE